MQKQTFWDRMRTAYQRYDRMMEKQGFYVVLTVCVLIIVVSAVITFRQHREAEIPVVIEEVQSAGGNQNAQTLREAGEVIASQGASQPVALPTLQPFSFVQPVSGVTIRPFSLEEPAYFPATGIWQVHAGIDLQTDYGTPVKSSASGRVTQAGEMGGLGLCVEIDHENGYTTLYAGLASAEYVKAGDPVYQGQVIGHVGNGVLAEETDSPHLHFEVRRRGEPVDPLLIFLGIDKNDTL
ncbi:MAG: M23 family metallopeptidase [Clostridia bacterium]|nr:M23 family metallopeptidase [Clostridia bacterium]